MKRRAWWWIGLLAGLLILVGARAVYSQMPAVPPAGDERLNGLPPGAGNTCQDSPGQPTPVQVTVIVPGPPPVCPTPHPPSPPTPIPPAVPEWTISGTVYDSNGTPLQGVAVDTAPPYGYYASDTTNADGQYTLAVVTGTYQVEAHWTGHPGPPIRVVSVPPSRGGVDLTFPSAWEVTGTVRDHEGVPLEGIEVLAGEFITWTNSAGNYLLRLEAGNYCASVHSEQRPVSPPAQTVRVPPGRSGVDFTYPPGEIARESPEQVVELPFSSLKGGLEATESYTITGVVRDSHDNPVPNAGIGASLADCRWVGQACSSPSGAYTITLEQAGTYFLRSGPEVRLVTVPPTAGGVNWTWYAVEGTVQDEMGQPAVGVLVRTRCGAQDCSGFSDVEGHYRLYVPPGEYQVTAEKRGYPQPPPQTVSAPPGVGGVDFVLPSGYVISGVVLDGGGLPLAGTVVLAAGPAGSASAESDTCGIYALLVPSGTYTVTADLEGYTSPPAQTATVPPDVYDLDWVLEPEPPPALYTISGTVSDSAGAPVEGATVCAYKLCTTSDADGAYQIDEPTGAYEVWAWKDGYGQAGAQTVTVPPDQPGVDFTLPLLYSIVGTVRDGGGQPLAAGVTAREPLCGSHAFTYWTKTGVYTLTLEPGTYEIGAVATTGSDGGYASTEVLSVTVPPTVQGVDLTIPLPVCYTLSGSVHDSSGNPLSGEVSAAACGRLGSTDKVIDGLYSLEVPAGTWFLSAEAAGAGYGGQQRTVVVSADTPGIDWTLEPAEPPCCGVYGLVSDEAGQPLRDVRVEVAEGPGDGLAVTASCGLYQLPLDAPGSYTLRASLTGYETVTQTVTVGTGTTWVKWSLAARPAVAQLSGTVRDETGQPMAWAVSIHGLDEFYEDMAKTDEAGHYVFSLPAGRYRVETEQHPCYTDQPAQEVTVPPDATAELAFKHRATNRASGRVASHLGQPIYRAVVSASSSAGQACANTDTNGNYLLRLAPGEWTLSVSQPPLCSYEPAPDRSMTVPPDQTGIDFYLFRQAYLYLPLCTKAWP